MILNNTNLPNIAQDLVRIHKVITRGLTIGLTRGKEFLADGFPSQDLKRGFTDYIQSFESVISAHHLGEDTVAFPALKARLVKAPYERLAADHKKIEAALTPIRESISETAGENPAAGLAVIVGGLRKVLATWTSHIGVEETSFGSNALAGILSIEEQANVSVLMAKHSQEHAGPPFLVLPFVLHNLSGADREAMAATFPAPVMELVQKDWKDKWSLMKPFLLE